MLEIENIKFYMVIMVIEAANMLSCTPQTVRNYIKQGKLKGKRIERPVVISEISLKEFLQIS